MPNITDDTVLIDGVAIHKSKDLSDILADHGINLRVTQYNDLDKTQSVTKIINVPYSLQFNTLKHKIKLGAVTTKKQLDETLLRYFNRLTGKL